jgi:RNA ligase
MREFPKTENLFVRDPDTYKLIVGELRDPAYAQIARWLVTEKVDGTNIRVLLRLDPETEHLCGVSRMLTEVRGRSDNANLPPGLEQKIVQTIQANVETAYHWLKEVTGDDPDIVVCLYGEGYGAGIQKMGGAYRPKEDGKAIRLFDVATSRVEWEDDVALPTGTWWRDWATVESAATALGLWTVPVLSEGSGIEEITEDVTDGFRSAVALEDGGDGLAAEGIVARTDPYLYDFRGHRVMFKLKTKDIEESMCRTHEGRSAMAAFYRGAAV